MRAKGRGQGRERVRGCQNHVFYNKGKVTGFGNIVLRNAVKLMYNATFVRYKPSSLLNYSLCSCNTGRASDLCFTDVAQQLVLTKV